ncbi:MAG: OmpA family protein [Maricaulaceae bacterium]|jgi:OOP family OmpA-OmpF porin
MHRRTKLAMTGLLFVLLGWLYIHTDRLPGSARKLEFKLAQDARAALDETGEAVWAEVHLSGRRATVRGLAPDERARDEALAAVRAAAGGGGIGEVRNETDLLMRVSPYTFQATLEGAELTLAGYAPDRPTRGALAARAARVFAGEVNADGVEIAAGAPSGADWLGAVDFGISQLVRLESGALDIADTEMRLTGEAGTAQVRADVARQILQAPYPFVGQADLAGGVGLPAPDPAQSEDVAAEAAAGVETSPEDAPGEVVSVERPAPRVARPAGASITACRAELEDLLGGETIRFQFAESAVSDASAPLLDAVAEAARRCEDYDLRIEGHTDTSGDADFNVYLSEQRARAVLSALVARGVDPSQLTAVGVGSAEPIAANDTAAGRASNRRIEIEVVEPAMTLPATDSGETRP